MSYLLFIVVLCVFNWVASVLLFLELNVSKNGSVRILRTIITGSHQLNPVGKSSVVHSFKCKIVFQVLQQIRRTENSAPSALVAYVALLTTLKGLLVTLMLSRLDRGQLFKLLSRVRVALFIFDIKENKIDLW